MVLTLAVMVPMAFLTEAVISHLSSELQTSDVEIQNGVIGRAWSGKDGGARDGQFYQAFVKHDTANPSRNQLLCDQLSDASLVGNSYIVTELLEGDVARAPDEKLQSAPIPGRLIGQSDRFFLLENKRLRSSPAGFLVRVRGSAQTQAALLADAPGAARCSSGYQVPLSPGQPEFCAVQDLKSVRVAPSARRNAFKLWTWLDGQTGAADHPCLCLADEPCPESAA